MLEGLMLVDSNCVAFSVVSLHYLSTQEASYRMQCFRLIVSR